MEAVGMTAQVTRPAPDFTTDAVFNGEFRQVKLADYRGKHLVLIFYPLDFTIVCPTELLAFSDQGEEFRKRNCEVVGISVDSKYTHLAWINTPRKQGGLGPVKYPLLSDLNKSIARSYGVLLEEAGVALRALFLIDKNGIVRHALANDLSLGRSVAEVLRLLDALQHYEQQGEMCPANWSKGMQGVKPDQAGAKQYSEAGPG
jgi:peroxiredoxin (alkyl hydroperoxide reductase subunit C)